MDKLVGTVAVVLMVIGLAGAVAISSGAKDDNYGTQLSLKQVNKCILCVARMGR